MKLTLKDAGLSKDVSRHGPSYVSGADGDSDTRLPLTYTDGPVVTGNDDVDDDERCPASKPDIVGQRCGRRYRHASAADLHRWVSRPRPRPRERRR